MDDKKLPWKSDELAKWILRNDPIPKDISDDEATEALREQTPINKPLVGPLVDVSDLPHLAYLDFLHNEGMVFLNEAVHHIETLVARLSWSTESKLAVRNASIAAFHARNAKEAVRSARCRLGLIIKDRNKERDNGSA